MQIYDYEEGGYRWLGVENFSGWMTPRGIEALYDSLRGGEAEALKRVAAQLPCAKAYMQRHCAEYGWDDTLIAKACVFTPAQLKRPVSYFPEFKRCWQNSFALAEKTGLKYVEGLAINLSGACLHAWNSTDGTDVLDYTWPYQHVNKYFGLEFDPAYLRSHGYKEGGLLLHHQEITLKGTKVQIA